MSLPVPSSDELMTRLQTFGAANNLSDDDLLFLTVQFIADKEAGDFLGSFNDFLGSIDETDKSAITGLVVEPEHPLVMTDFFNYIYDPSPPPGCKERLVAHIVSADKWKTINDLMRQRITLAASGRTLLRIETPFEDGVMFTLSVIVGDVKVYIDPSLVDVFGVVDVLPPRESILGRYQFKSDHGEIYIADVVLSPALIGEKAPNATT